jgi:hypothetical protein
VLRYGAYDAEVIARLRYMADDLAPVLAHALAARGPIDLRALMAQALLMGDEMHQRNVAASSLLARALLPALCEDAGAPGLGRLAPRLRNDQFFLNSRWRREGSDGSVIDVPG